MTTAISVLSQYHSGHLYNNMLHQSIQCLTNCLNKLKAVQNYRIFTCRNERKTLCHFSIIAHNRPGVLSKITGLISRRGYNIDSLMSGTTEKPGYARLTITVDADDRTVDQISRQVEKISEVEKITVR